MTALNITEGKLIVELGVAAVRPQEFITLMLVHKLNKV
jgi:phage tail sheath protein FI